MFICLSRCLFPFPFFLSRGLTRFFLAALFKSCARESLSAEAMGRGTNHSGRVPLEPVEVWVQEEPEEVVAEEPEDHADDDEEYEEVVDLELFDLPAEAVLRIRRGLVMAVMKGVVTGLEVIVVGHPPMVPAPFNRDEYAEWHVDWVFQQPGFLREVVNIRQEFAEFVPAEPVFSNLVKNRLYQVLREDDIMKIDGVEAAETDEDEQDPLGQGDQDPPGQGLSGARA